MAISANAVFVPTLMWTLLGLWLAHFVLNAIYNAYFHALSNVPGPKPWGASRLPFIRALLKGTIIHDFEKLHHRYGPIVRTAPDEVSFAHPKAWNDVLQPHSGARPFLKDPTWWESQPGMALTILSAIQPEDHSRIRRELVPAFTPRALKDQEPIVVQYVNLLVERLRARVASEASDEGVELDIGPWFNFTTFDILGDLGLGESFCCLENSRYHPWIRLVFDSVKAATWVASARFFPVIQHVLIQAISPLLQKMQMSHLSLIADKVQRRLNWEVERPDIMSHVIRGGVDKALPRDQLNSTFMVLANAGSETSATALTGTMNYLVNIPDKLEILVDEIRSRFDSEDEMTLDALQELPYLTAVLKEGMRLCPPVGWILPRRVPVGGATVCGTWLPEGTAVSIQPYAMNRSVDYFHSPTSFFPERWLEDARTNPASSFYSDQRDGVQPFSVGPRNCLGQHLAWAEMRQILARLLYTFDFEVVEDKQVRWEDLKTFLFVEKKPVYVRLRERGANSHGP